MTLLVALIHICVVSSVRGEDQKVDPAVEDGYESLVKSIEDLSNSDEYSIIASASHSYGRRWPPMSRISTMITETTALALPIWYHYRDNKVAGFWTSKKFDSIYQDYVVKPCVRAKELGEKFDTYISEHPEIDDYKHTGTLTPWLYFTNVVKLCKTQDAVGAKKKVYNQFRKYKKDDYVQPIALG